MLNLTLKYVSAGFVAVFLIMILMYGTIKNKEAAIPATTSPGAIVMLNDLDQEDPRLVQEIRRAYLIPPPPPNTPLFLVNPSKEEPSQGQVPVIQKFFENKRNGFFVEAGGHDGEFISNTIYFERKLGWRGILIEPDPKGRELLLAKHRNVWVVPACLSLTQKPAWVKFNLASSLSKVVVGDSGLDVQCLPIYSILLALNVTHIDFFSLDVEGAELAVLKTIPWDKIHITCITVEYEHVAEGRDAVHQFIVSKGYTQYAANSTDGWTKHDAIYVKKPK